MNNFVFNVWYVYKQNEQQSFENRKMKIVYIWYFCENKDTGWTEVSWSAYCY